MEQKKAVGQKKKLTGPIDLIKQAWPLFTKTLSKFVKIMLVPYIPILGLILIMLLYMGADYLFKGPGLSMTIVNIVLGFLGIVLLIATIVISLFFYPAMLLFIKKPDEKVEIKKLYKQATPFVWGFVLISFLVGMAELLGTILFIIPGIIFAVWLVFAPIILIFENKRGWQALRRSRELVKDYWWAILGRFIVLGIFILLLRLPAYILQWMAQENTVGAVLEGVAGLYGFVIAFVVTPVTLIFMVLLYKELVSIKGVSKLAPWSKGKRVLLTLVVILLPLLLLGGGGYFAFTEFKANFSNGLPENMYLQDGEEAPSWEDFMKQMEEYEDFDLEDLDLEGLEDLELDYNPEV